jgi:hypothetical protein
MKLKIVLMTLVLVMLMARLGAATRLEVVGNGWLYVFFDGTDVKSASVDSTFWNDGEIRDDHLLAQGDVVVFRESTDPFFVDLVVAHGSAEFDQTYRGIGSYGTSVQSNCGIGVIFSDRDYSTDTMYTVAFASSDFTISQYASNFDPFTSVEVTQSNLTEDDLRCCDLGYSEMLVSWWSNSLSSNPVDPGEWNEIEWNGDCNLQLTSDYGFSVDILSLWQTPAIGIEIVEYLSG